MSSFNLLSLIKSDSDLIDELIYFSTSDGKAESPTPPMAWPMEAQALFDKMVETPASVQAYLTTNGLNRSPTVESEDEETASDEAPEALGGEVVPFNRLDFFFSKSASDVTKRLMARISETGLTGNEIAEALTMLTPIYSAYKGLIPPVPRPMTRQQTSLFKLVTTTETMDVGPFLLRKIIEDEGLPGSISCSPGQPATLTISGVTVKWDDPEVGATNEERAALTAVLSKHHSKSKTIVFCNCENLGKAHSILVNTFLIKREGEGFSVSERTLLEGSTGYEAVRLLLHYHSWFDMVCQFGKLTKDAWEFHNMVQIYIFKNRKGITKPLFDHVLTAEVASNTSAQRAISSMKSELMNMGTTIAAMSSLQNEIGHSKRQGRNYGANEQLFRANASLYGKATNAMTEYADFVALARTVKNLVDDKVYIGFTKDEGKLALKAFQAEKLATVNYDPSTGSWLPLAGTDLKGKSVVCGSYQRLMSSRPVAYPACLDNIIHLVDAGASFIATTWKTQEFSNRTIMLLREWFALVPSRFNKFQFLKAGKAHTSHFYLMMWCDPSSRDGVTFSDFVLSAMQQTVRMAYALEMFTAAGCEHGVKPDMVKALPLIKDSIYETVDGVRRPIALDRNVTFRLNVRELTMRFDPKSSGSPDDRIRQLDNKDSTYEDDRSESSRPSVSDVEEIAVSGAEKESERKAHDSTEPLGALPVISADARLAREATAKRLAEDAVKAEERRLIKAREDKERAASDEAAKRASDLAALHKSLDAPVPVSSSSTMSQSDMAELMALRQAQADLRIKELESKLSQAAVPQSLAASKPEAPPKKRDRAAPPKSGTKQHYAKNVGQFSYNAKK